MHAGIRMHFEGTVATSTADGNHASGSDTGCALLAVAIVAVTAALVRLVCGADIMANETGAGE